MTIPDPPDTMPPVNPRLRGRAEQDEILLAFAERLREHPKLSKSTVVVEDQAIPEAFPAGGFCIVVAPGAGEFAYDLNAGGGNATPTEDGSITIGIYLQSFKDRLGSKESMLTKRPNTTDPAKAFQSKLSLTGWKRLVLRHLLCTDELTPLGQPLPWEPVVAHYNEAEAEWQGRPLLRDLPQPVRATSVLDVPEHAGWRGLQLTFSCTWDWDLYRE